MIVKCRGKKFKAYTDVEAKEAGIVPIPDWRKAKQGDWIRTWDEKIIQVLSRRTEKHASSIKEYNYIRTGFGEHGTHKNNIYAVKQASSHDRQYSGSALLRDVRPSAMQKTFVDNLLQFGDIDGSGMWDAESVILAYQKVYRDNNAEQSLRRGISILKRSRIKEYISMNMRDKLIENSLDDDWIIEQYKGIINSERTPANVKLNAVNRVSDMLGHHSKNREEQTEEQIFALSDGEMKQLSSHRKKLIKHGNGNVKLIANDE